MIFFTHVRCHLKFLWTFLMILVLLDRCKKPFWEMNLRLRCVVCA
ncbi:Protein of unknown function [Gryllus bimaculatus]|nr:Protein of unknown function [Gryllus bimaculatus]